MKDDLCNHTCHIVGEGKRQLQKDQSVYKGYSEDIINSVIKITTNF